MIDIRWNPTSRELRQFAGIWCPAFFALVGGIIYYRTGWLTGAACLWAAAALVFTGGLLWPRSARPLYVGLIVCAYPIGWAVSHVLLAAVFYLVLTPIGLAMRLLGRDPMERRFERSGSSYWRRRPGSADASGYFRQF